MPGVFRHPLSGLPRVAEEALKAGLGGVILFGVLPQEAKDPMGRGAYAEDGVVQRAIRLLKREFPELLVLADTCLCEYTDHGHCGVVKEGPPGLLRGQRRHLRPPRQDRPLPGPGGGGRGGPERHDGRAG